MAEDTSQDAQPDGPPSAAHDSASSGAEPPADVGSTPEVPDAPAGSGEVGGSGAAGPSESGAAGSSGAPASDAADEEAAGSSGAPGSDAAGLGGAVGLGGAAGGDVADEEEAGGFDPQLIALCVGLWIVALGILYVKWDRLWVDWYLGDIKEAIVVEGRVDEPAVDALVDMAGDGSVVAYVRDELSGPQRNAHEVYRVVMVKILERIPSSKALEGIVEGTRDDDARVRANSYLSLKARVDANPDERERVVEALEEAIAREDEIVAASYVVQMLDDLDALGDYEPSAAWPFVRAMRNARAPQQLHIRREAHEAAVALIDADEEPPPFDPEAPPDERDARARAFEEWYAGLGGKIPEGQGFDEWQAAVEAAKAEAEAARGEGAGPGLPRAPDGSEAEPVGDGTRDPAGGGETKPAGGGETRPSGDGETKQSGGGDEAPAAADREDGGDASDASGDDAGAAEQPAPEPGASQEGSGESE